MPIPDDWVLSCMSPFPFSSEDWDRVKDASIELVNASAADDPNLMASRFIELQAVLGDLRAKYGEHPILLETEADFCDDDAVALALYTRALKLAKANELPTNSILAPLHFRVRMG